jgi:hypothetical protein
MASVDMAIGVLDAAGVMRDVVEAMLLAGDEEHALTAKVTSTIRSAEIFIPYLAEMAGNDAT